MTELTLEERNFENLVWFYSSELEKMLKGRSAVNVFSPCGRRGLRKKGVLCLRSVKFGYDVSDRARKVLARKMLEELR